MFQFIRYVKIIIDINYTLYWNPKYVLLLLFSTIVTYLCSLFIGKAKTKTKKKLIVTVSLVLNLLILVLFKYYNFIFDNLKLMLYNLNISIDIPTFDVLLPVGISFYIFQALGYTLDAFRGEIKVFEKAWSCKKLVYRDGAF